jgi:hypothetical protein
MAADPKKPEQPTQPPTADAEAKLKDALAKLAEAEKRAADAEAELSLEQEEHAATKASLKLAGNAALNAAKAASEERQKRAAGCPKNGAELVLRLKETHSPDNKLRPARDCLTRIKFSEGRVATCQEVYEALADAWPESAILEKARQIIDFGVWKAPEERKEIPIEESLAKG